MPRSRLSRSATFAFALVLSGLGAVSAHATAYTFSETYDNGGTTGGAGAVVTVTGTFDGTANGNLITGLSGFTLYFNGVEAADPSSLLIRAFNTGGFYDSNAVLSFDGLQNNLILSTSSDPATQLPAIAMSTVTTLGNGNADFGYNTELQGSNNDPTTTILLISEATAVPEPASLALLAFGITGIAAARRIRQG